MEFYNKNLCDNIKKVRPINETVPHTDYKIRISTFAGTKRFI